MNPDLRFKKTDALIKNSLLNLLQIKGFNKITIDDLCKQAIIGRSTFYHHYADKYELLDKIIQEYTIEFQSLII